MEKQYTALLYSKYSKHCTDLINRIDLSNIDFTKETKLLPVCIDNDEIRKKIISSTNIEIHSVPTVLIIYEDGGVEKYENNDAFNWVEEIIKRFMFLQKQQETTPIPSSNAKDEELYFEEDFEDGPVVINVPPPQQVKPKSKTLPKIQQAKSKQKQIQPKNNKIPSNKTSIEDLEELELHDEDIQENFEFNPEPIEQVESTNALSEKRNDLLSLAAEMQKSRDTFVDNIDKPKNIPFDR